MRLFVGISVPEQQAQVLAREACRIAQNHAIASGHARFTVPADMHITLSFLGEIARDHLPKIERELATLALRNFFVEANGFGTFSRTAVLFAAVVPTAALVSCAHTVQQMMENAGIRREERTYRPHITLARVKVKSAELLRKEKILLQPFRVESITLFETRPQPGNPRYRAVASYPLLLS